MTTPSDQMSVRRSTSFVERTCSGDMYRGEPIAWSSSVSDCSFGRFCESLGLAPEFEDGRGGRVDGEDRPVPSMAYFEIPKSSSLMTGSPTRERARKRLAGL